MSILSLAGLAGLVAAIVEILVVSGLLPVEHKTLALAIGSIVVFAVRTLGGYFGWDMTMIDQAAEFIAQLILMLIGTWFTGMVAKVMVSEIVK